MEKATERSFYKITTPTFGKFKDNIKPLGQSLKNICERGCFRKVACLQHFKK